MAPRDFWAMHPEDFWWAVEARPPVKRYGSMTEHEVAEIYREAYGEPPGADAD
jgi:hypothetical protein